MLNLSSRIRGIASMTLLIAISGHAEELLQNPDFADGDAGWIVSGSDESTYRSQVVDAEGASESKAMRVEVTPPDGADSWAIRLQQIITQPLESGEELTLTVEARSPDGVPIKAFVEEAVRPYDKVVLGNTELTPRFKTYTFRGTTERAYDAEGARVTIHLAMGKGVIEFGKVSLTVGSGGPSGPASPREPMTTEPGGAEPDAAPLPGADPAAHEVPAAGEAVLGGDGTGGWRLYGKQKDLGSVEVVEVNGQPFTHALRATTTAATETPHNLQLVQKNATPVREGDVMLATFHLRGLETQDETGEAKTVFVFELGGGKYTKSIVYPASAGTSGGTSGGASGGWQTFHVPFVSKGNYAPGEARAILQMGFGPQVFEVGGISLTNFGTHKTVRELPVTKVSYRGREHDAPWRAEAQQRIEELRKGDLTVKVVDAAGRPVPGATVRVEMTRHAFGFGSVINASWMAGYYGEPDPSDLERYKSTFLDLFNMATFEGRTKWAEWENYPRRQAVYDAFEWLEEHGIDSRGHVLVWPSYRRTPEDLPKLADDPTAMRYRVESHLRDEVVALKGYVDAWDVVNEPFNHHDLLDVMGREVMIDWFRLVHELDPDAELYLNEASTPNQQPSHVIYDALERDLRMLLDADAPVHGVGMQGHFGWTLNSPEEVYGIFDRFAAMGLKIQVTELDINITDEQLQADYLRDVLTVAFSHPAVHAVVMWGFWEGRHWRPDAALIRKDWTDKPAAAAYRDLVKGQWWTNERAQTGTAGSATVSGFLGEHRVTVEHSGRSASAGVDLDRGGRVVTVELP